jgi:Protein of unknown function (DUF2934)
MANEAPTEARGRADPDAPGDSPASVEGSKRPADGQIRERAYLIWVDEGRPDGRELDHWLRAKWEVEQER